MCLIFLSYKDYARRKTKTVPESDWIPPYQIRYAKAAPPRGYWLMLDDHEERYGQRTIVAFTAGLFILN